MTRKPFPSNGLDEVIQPRRAPSQPRQPSSPGVPSAPRPHLRAVSPESDTVPAQSESSFMTPSEAPPSEPNPLDEVKLLLAATQHDVGHLRVLSIAQGKTIDRQMAAIELQGETLTNLTQLVIAQGQEIVRQGAIIQAQNKALHALSEEVAAVKPKTGTTVVGSAGLGTLGAIAVEIVSRFIKD